MLDIASMIASFNAGRDPERLAMKYKAMHISPFVLLRGTCHRPYLGCVGAVSKFADSIDDGMGLVARRRGGSRVVAASAREKGRR
jgi:hypothetical protein